MFGCDSRLGRKTYTEKLYAHRGHYKITFVPWQDLTPHLEIVSQVLCRLGYLGPVVTTRQKRTRWHEGAVAGFEVFYVKVRHLMACVKN